MKKLPIGMQDIKNLIQDGYLYVDKTDIIYKLVTEGRYYFLSRPRRFGKSLLVSTLRAIFRGEKELFSDYFIYDTDYDWQQHPIIHLDFTRISSKNPEELRSELERTLHNIAHSYGQSIECPTLKAGLEDLVKKLSERGQVVFLVDEYDKPLIDNLHQIEIAEENRTILKEFYETLKGLSEYLRFVFVTGVTKFSQVSLFSGFNNLNDITISPRYATLLGYTESDLRKFMQDRIKKTAEELSLTLADVTEESVLTDMKEWYNGYLFSWGALPVYNPHSTLSFLDTGRVQNYWYRTGTPTFLIEQISKYPDAAVEFSGILAEESELLDIANLTRLDLKPLMWQAGYLTIRGYNQSMRLYELDFPNREVREAFFKSLLHQFAKFDTSMLNAVALQCRRQLEGYQLTPFFETINALFARIPYALFTKGSEASYHAVFLAMLEAMGIKARAEQQTNIGRIDLVIELENCIYIMELKFNKSAEIALEQIESNKYKQRYSIENKDLVLLGINFSETTRNISEYKAILYRKDNPQGEEIA